MAKKTSNRERRDDQGHYGRGYTQLWERHIRG